MHSEPEIIRGEAPKRRKKSPGDEMAADGLENENYCAETPAKKQKKSMNNMPKNKKKKMSGYKLLEKNFLNRRGLQVMSSNLLALEII